ncbi:MAG: tRNA (adenosine(37)-N6)-threonylcarbamoyltransferase complex ATPase subunit type 1 TsaE [Candidatus Hydrogenedentes bacterium]|nr:tRNA (adenosine(37)-N6)-threonylcarbamoyltransferase complex ATPase subunit type 1 TsaE [Candidatus Hydrogenedentota bacterium]
MIEILSRSWQETEHLGTTVGKLLKGISPVTLALSGELASGKTSFVKGLVKEICGEWWVHSPTFTIVNVYGTPPKVIHIDCYRISSYRELVSIGAEELIGSECICVIEWADKVKELLPADHISIHFEHIDETSRRILISDPTDIIEQPLRNRDI